MTIGTFFGFVLAGLVVLGFFIVCRGEDKATRFCAVLAVAPMTFAVTYGLIDAIALDQQTGVAKVVSMEYVPAHRETWRVSVDINGERVSGEVIGTLHDAVRVGDRVQLTYTQARLSRRIYIDRVT